jgi:hypothetical protein
MTLSLDTHEKRTFARSRLQKAIDDGRASGARVITRIMSEIPSDELTPAVEGRLTLTNGRPHYVTRSGASPLTSHAFGQLTERLGAKNLRDYFEKGKEEGEGWRIDLGETIAREHAAHTSSRFLVRKVGGEIRGVLSDSFKRYDSRPLLDAFVGAAQSLGAIPIGGHATDTRADLRVILPQIFEPTEGECVVYGLSWQNSDFGAASYGLAFFTMRLVCLNGMVAERMLRKTHLGSRLEEGMLYSASTIDHDTKALIGVTADSVRNFLAPAKLEERSEHIKALASRELSIDAALRGVSKSLTKAELEAVKNAYEGPDQLNMPAGNTAWRFANALSWVANGSELSEDRRIELQEIAGKVAA